MTKVYCKLGGCLAVFQVETMDYRWAISAVRDTLVNPAVSVLAVV